MATLNLKARHLSLLQVFHRFYSTQVQGMEAMGVYIRPNNGPNSEYPFPGQVCCSALRNPKKLPVKRVKPKAPAAKYYSLNSEQIANMISFPVNKDVHYRPQSNITSTFNWNMKVELSATECPSLIKTELEKIFPEVKTREPPSLTIINFNEVIQNEDEDELKISDKPAAFTVVATSICAMLRVNGYWADFIDPVSGISRLNEDSFGRITKERTDNDRSGFEVEETSGTKVINDTTLRQSPFVWSVFTNAPISSDVVKDILSSADAEA